MKDKISKKEFAWYVVGAVIAIFGLTLMIMGIVGHHLGGSLSDNFVKTAESNISSSLKFTFTFRTFGIIFLGAGTLLVVGALAFNARKTDREVERSIRRQQRMSAADAAIEVKKAVEIIEEPAPQPAPAVEEKKE